MKAPETLSLGDRGFDLVLGGGVRVVERVPGRSGAAILVRGPAGSGKTSLGLYLAVSLARSRRGAVAYGCVELLPSELEAQLHTLWGADRDVHIAHVDAPRSEGADGVFVHARVLDLRGGSEALGEVIQRFFKDLEARQHRPVVVVVDSLSDGYGLGAGASREFADAICKLTAHLGVMLVLLEESVTDAPSPWVFAADTVIELGVVSEDADATRSSPFERRLAVAKHRFAPSDYGPHRFAWEAPGALCVYPRPSAWLEPWAAALTGVPSAGRVGAARIVLALQDEMAVEGSVLAVTGPDLQRVLGIVWAAVPVSRGADLGLPDLHVEFDRPLGERQDDPGADRIRRHLGVAHPYLSAHRLVRLLLDAVGELRALRRVVLGDLQSLRSCWGEDGLRRGIGAFCLLMRRAGMLVVLYESAPSRVNIGPRALFMEPGLAEARAVDLSDLSVEAMTSGFDGVVSIHKILVTRRREGVTLTRLPHSTTLTAAWASLRAPLRAFLAHLPPDLRGAAVIFGSTAVALNNVDLHRLPGDLDLFVSEATFERLARESGFLRREKASVGIPYLTVEGRDDVEVWPQFPGVRFEDVVSRARPAESAFGMKVASLLDLLHWKQAQAAQRSDPAALQRDQADAGIIEKALPKG